MPQVMIPHPSGCYLHGTLEILCCLVKWFFRWAGLPTSIKGAGADIILTYHAKEDLFTPFLSTSSGLVHFSPRVL
jgi:hypothetical protein